MIPLSSVRNHHCNEHRELSKICAVVNCEQKVEVGFRTCPLQEHREVELYHYQRGKAMFQLKKRLERLKVSQTVDSLSTNPGARKSRFAKDDIERSATAKDLQPLAVPDSNEIDDTLEGPAADDDEDVTLDTSGICDGKPETGNRHVRARFGRRWTHNEQLCVASCGVILGRATFYGSEAPNGVRVRVFYFYCCQLLLIICARHFGGSYSQPKPHFRLFSGTTTTAESEQCWTEILMIILTRITLTGSRSLLTYSTLTANTRNQMRHVTVIATRISGLSCVQRMEIGVLIHLPPNRQMCGLAVSKLSSGRCRWIGMNFFWMR